MQTDQCSDTPGVPSDAKTAERKIQIDASQLIVHPDPEIKDLVPFFLNNRRKELPDLERLVKERSFEEIRRLAHTWKGICRPYGFPFLEKLSRELEVAAQIEDENQIHVVCEAIKEFLLNVRIES